MEIRFKECSRCRRNLSLDKFGKNRSTNDGLSYYCKECRAKYRNKSYSSRLCVVCQKEFIPKMIDSVICSKACSQV